LCGDRRRPQGRAEASPYLAGMVTATCTELEAAMNSLGGWRPSSVLRPEGDAIVVLAVGGTEVASWPLIGSSHPDLSVIDNLAHLALMARRRGGAITVRGAGPQLQRLIHFVGLDDVVAVDDGSPAGL
jgi:hypothetical protein